MSLKPRSKAQGGKSTFLPLYRPDVAGRERQYLMNCLDDVELSTGSYVGAFERAFAEYVGADHALSVSSGTTALHLALHSLGVGAGDAVIVPTLTFVATANAVIQTGATPIFADCDPGSWVLCPRTVAPLITDRTKAIIVAHLYGSVCDMRGLAGLAEQYDIPLVEDCAQALGGRFGDRHVGTWGTLGTFKLDHFETVRVRLPREVVNAQFIRVRVLPAPHCNAGFYKLGWIRLVKNPRRRPRLSRIADLEDLKARTRVEAAKAEADKAETCNHLPVALTFELTAACNLTCSHCFSHGQPELHRFHNKMPSISIEQLEALAHDVFPSLTVISVVGRGEPMVLKGEVWNRLLELAAEYRVRLAITTNGYFLQRRITSDLLPLIDNINVSMDGLSPGVFAANRGGADINRVWENVQFYDDLRRSAALARAPRLCFAYTLKKNNVAELSDFVRKIATFDADTLTTRHLITLFDSSKDESLLLMDPREANQHLRAAYDLLQVFGIRRDCVPLFSEPVSQDEEAEPFERTDMIEGPDQESAYTESAPATPVPSQGSAEKLSGEPCVFIHRMPVIMAGGEVMVCAVPHAEKAGDLASTAGFQAIWNGETLKSFRRRLNTSDEWPQCRHCSYREARVGSQQELAAERKRYDSAQQSQFSIEALDFRQTGEASTTSESG